MNKLYALLCLLLFAATAYGQVDKDLVVEIYQIGVTRGHATLIVVKDANNANIVYSSTLIDAGDKSEDGQVIAEVIEDVANRQLDRVLITHTDGDHWRGLVNDTHTPGTTGLLDRRLRGSVGDPIFSPTALTLWQCLEADQQVLMATEMEEANLEANFPGLDVRDWTVTQDFDLAPALPGRVMLRTLAINTRIRNVNNLNPGGLRISTASLRSSESRNDRSAVALLTWGNFSFLIQGDLEAKPNNQGRTRYAASSSRIGRTWDDYRILSGPGRLPQEWDASPQNNAQSREPDPDFDEVYDPVAGITRHSYNILSIARENRDQAIVPIMRLDFYQHMIAWPDQSRHLLGEVIGELNGQGSYAHACVALVPHHGALTSNLWFDSVHGLVGCNRINKHGHPNADAVEAMYNTAGIRKFYFTYLRDLGGLRQGTYCYDTRATKFSNGADFNDGANANGTDFHALSDNGVANNRYFRFSVRYDLSQGGTTPLRKFEATDEWNLENGLAPYKDFGYCERGGH